MNNRARPLLVGISHIGSWGGIPVVSPHVFGRRAVRLVRRPAAADFTRLVIAEGG